MNSFWLWLKNIFSISKTESNGFVYLVLFIILCLVVPYVFKVHYTQPLSYADASTMDSLLTEIERNVMYDTITHVRYNSNQPKWNQQKVKQKGIIKKPDILKTEWSSPTRPPIEIFNINQADTAQLRKLYGIGPVLSNRIVKYRDLLGGFVHKNQLREVYGLSDSLIVALDTLTFIEKHYKPIAMPINTISVGVLQKHPYINYKIARALDNYKYQHGLIKGPEDLYTIHLLDSLSIARIIPYISY